MKHILIILSATFLLTSCKKIDSLTQFDIEYNETAVIPSSAGINIPLDILTPDVTTDSESKFAINDTRKDLIEQIILKELTLTINTPVNADFSFLESIHVYIQADGLDLIEVASLDNVPQTATSITLDVTGVDLQEYIKKDEFSLKLTTVTDEFLTQDHSINVYTKFFVDAKILGQ